MVPQRELDVVHMLIRHQTEGPVRFLVYPHDKWRDAADRPYWTLPAKKTVHHEHVDNEPFESFSLGTSLEHFVDEVMKQDLRLQDDDYVLEEEIDPEVVELARFVKGGVTVVATALDPAVHAQATRYTIYPVDIWVKPLERERLRAAVEGVWLTVEEALQHPQLSPTAACIFRMLPVRERRLEELFAAEPGLEQRPNTPRLLLRKVSDRPSMEALARRWFSRNRNGVRYLSRQKLDEILDVGDRAFNLRVADPYQRYQLQGVGFTWSFFTHKDPQDIHVHGAPIVEIYGVLEGRLEVWWKPYYDRGTSAWSHVVLETGDWLEIESLQCHIVRWLGEGKGVVFKAGPGPLAEVGKLGVKGKTRCECHCMKPAAIRGT